jgi:hypothetical protein
LLQLLRYDEATGTLFWRERSADACNETDYWSAEHTAKVFSTRYAGKPALNRIMDKGYRRGSLAGRTTFAHRVVWKMAYGSEPEHIDHINGDRADNRLINLRAVTRTQNNRNAKRRRDNTTGVTGVKWHKANRKWVAVIKNNGKDKYLGSFLTIEEATEARKKAALLMGYSERHGAAQ